MLMSHGPLSNTYEQRPAEQCSAGPAPADPHPTAEPCSAGPAPADPHPTALPQRSTVAFCQPIRPAAPVAQPHQVPDYPEVLTPPPSPEGPPKPVCRADRAAPRGAVTMQVSFIAVASKDQRSIVPGGEPFGCCPHMMARLTGGDDLGVSLHAVSHFWPKTPACPWTASKQPGSDCNITSHQAQCPVHMGCEM